MITCKDCNEPLMLHITPLTVTMPTPQRCVAEQHAQLVHAWTANPHCTYRSWL